MSSVHTPLDAENEKTHTELFDSLADERRRRVLGVVEQADDRYPVELLAKMLADETDESDTETFQLSLVHTHLPKLDDAGLVTYDADDRVVTSTPSTANALAVVEAAEVQMQ
ncbi:hypothetical protein AUR64_04705 [Haloprofundus marisrubri]|uniref:DUF7344 domain-containing protein n=1 Tax=Haloprofundus marisrubri TaxID=1514971 RepID=A0A0W1RCR9_9EURY|nr:helix-turn-helix transcriptional regulator [Haloprofundus marisrubri]KTG11230.1 hypothetical protein AUR64_04705 [Haloprofundus marisrubri]